MINNPNNARDLRLEKEIETLRNRRCREEKLMKRKKREEREKANGKREEYERPKENTRTKKGKIEREERS